MIQAHHAGPVQHQPDQKHQIYERRDVGQIGGKFLDEVVAVGGQHGDQQRAAQQKCKDAGTQSRTRQIPPTNSNVETKIALACGNGMPRLAKNEVIAIQVLQFAVAGVVESHPISKRVEQRSDPSQRSGYSEAESGQTPAESILDILESSYGKKARQTAGPWNGS